MTAAYLLPLADLHATAPGAVGAIAHFDGDFPEAPIFHPPLWDGSRWVWDYDWSEAPTRGLALDCRIPSVAARLAGLCARALEQDPRRNHESAQTFAWHREWSLASFLHRATAEVWTEESAARLAALSLSLAPQIAALRGGA